MNKYFLTTAVIIVVVIIAGLAIQFLTRSALAPTHDPLSSPAASVTPSPTRASSVSPSAPSASGITIAYPKANQNISSPLKIRGLARGVWFFEGSFPIRLENKAGQTLATATAKAQSNWMTTEQVPFTAELSFSGTTVEPAFLVFSKDNPSGLPQNDASYSLPVIIK